jgi:AcrR family transcriptional regulator
MPKVSEAYMEARYQQILDAAVACFVENGFHQTTMQDICRKAGLSPGALYRYFSSKEEMVEATWRRRRPFRAERFDKALQKQSDPALALHELWGVQMRRVNEGEMETETRLWVQFLAEALRNPRIGKAIRSNWNDAIKRVKPLVERAQKAGEISRDLDPEVVLRMAVALLNGLMLQKMFDKDLDLSKFAGVQFTFERVTGKRQGKKGVK